MLCADSETRRFSRAGSRFKGILVGFSAKHTFGFSLLDTDERNREERACVRACVRCVLLSPLTTSEVATANPSTDCLISVVDPSYRL